MGTPSRVLIVAGILLLITSSGFCAEEVIKKKNFVSNTLFQSKAHRTALIELYTSEGCSSCPPADQWFNQLKNSDRLWNEFVPVAFHVDYWDYLGWQDTFASKNFTERQRAYSRFWRVSSVYTPAMMLNGEEWSGWSKGHDIYAAPNIVGVLKVKRVDNDFIVNFTPAESLKGKQWVAHIALLGFEISSRITDGENRGNTFEHNFTVLAYKTRKMDKYSSGPQARFNISQQDASMIPPKSGFAVWVNAEDNILPIQAVGGYLPY